MFVACCLPKVAEEKPLFNSHSALSQTQSILFAFFPEKQKEAKQRKDKRAGSETSPR